MEFAIGLLLGALCMWARIRHQVTAWKESNRNLAVTLRQTRIEKFDVERRLEHAERMLNGDVMDGDRWKWN